MRDLCQDVRYAVRSLGRTPLFTLSALLTLALGIGATSSVFVVANALWLRGLPFPDAQQLVRITVDREAQQSLDVGLAVPELKDLEERVGLFESVSGLYAISVNLTGGDEPERVEAQLVSVSFFDALKLPPQLGRTFESRDYQPGVGAVAVISDSLWKRRFSAAGDIVGKTIRLDNDLFAIAGVMPSSFVHPSRSVQGKTDVWIPSGYSATPFREPVRGLYILNGALARTKAASTIQDVQVRLDSLSRELERDFPEHYPQEARIRFRAISLRDDLGGESRRAVLVLGAAVLCVLLVACANLAGLMLVRAAGRRPEIAVRMAIGASPNRLVRLMLTESLVLAGSGGVVGLMFAFLSLDTIRRLLPESILNAYTISLDTSAVGVTLAVSLSTVLLFGLWPAIAAAKPSFGIVLRSGSTGMATSRGGHRLRGVLAATQFAFALALLIGSTLLIRTFVELQRVDLGFEPDSKLTARFWLPLPNDPTSGPYFRHERRVTLFRELDRRLRELPGVQNVGWVSRLPMSEPRPAFPFAIEGKVPGRDLSYGAEALLASPSYFETLKIPLVRGRPLAETDTESTPPVLVISESFVGRYFTGDDPIGRRIKLTVRPNAPWMMIVGVVRDVRSRAVDAAPEPQMYLPMAQTSGLSMAAVIATGGDPSLLAAQVRRLVRAADPDLPVYAIEPMASLVQRATGPRRIVATLLTVFAAAAVVLAGVGIFSVMASLVHQRTKEIGLRIALGARRPQVIRLVLGRSAWIVAAGILAGLGGALLSTELLASLLYGTSPRDAATFVFVPMLLVAVALVASLLPTLRALRIQPTVALRQD